MIFGKTKVAICDRCGEYNGVYRVPSSIEGPHSLLSNLLGYTVRVECVCKGPTCPDCGRLYHGGAYYMSPGDKRPVSTTWSSWAHRYHCKGKR